MSVNNMIIGTLIAMCMFFSVNYAQSAEQEPTYQQNAVCSTLAYGAGLEQTAMRIANLVDPYWAGNEGELTYIIQTVRSNIHEQATDEGTDVKSVYKKNFFHYCMRSDISA